MIYALPHPSAACMSTFVGGWAQVKNIMRVNTVQLVIHIFACDPSTWTDGKRGEKKTNEIQVKRCRIYSVIPT